MQSIFNSAWKWSIARLPRFARLIFPILIPASTLYGYSVLTHEAIVDSLWDTSIQKMPLKRFPAATPEELRQAHAYVYRGCILQDTRYYPFSSGLFSDLTLAHYAADNSGHRQSRQLNRMIFRRRSNY